MDENGFNHSMSFVRGDEVDFFDYSETISIDLTCTNRHLAEFLAVGDICLPSQKTPSFVNFRNLTRPTPSIRPVLDGSLHWTLISNFSLNYLSLLQVNLLKNVIRSYDFLAMHDIQAKRRTTKRLNAIKDIQTSTVDILFKGFPIRGVQSTMEIEDKEYTCEGELFLFGTVLANFFALYATINSFHVLEIVNLTNNERYKWDIQKGRQPII
jgi:type VI secretion system protein ImpG